jgi:hypothetical protein
MGKKAKRKHTSKLRVTKRDISAIVAQKVVPPELAAAMQRLTAELASDPPPKVPPELTAAMERWRAELGSDPLPYPIPHQQPPQVERATPKPVSSRKRKRPQEPRVLEIECALRQEGKLPANLKPGEIARKIEKAYAKRYAPNRVSHNTVLRVLGFQER